MAARSDTDRAAVILGRWKSRKPFATSDLFGRRIAIDRLTEDDLATILALPSHVYSALLAPHPQWVGDLEALYSATNQLDSLTDLARDAGGDTGAFLQVAAPLLSEGLRRLRAALPMLSADDAPFDTTTVERMLVPRLIEAVTEALSLVMVLELNVARVKGTLTGDSPEARFNDFCERLGRVDVRQALLCEYSVLFRSLHSITMDWVDSSLELLQRLVQDWGLIRTSLSGGADPGRLVSLEGAGDAHRRGRRVAILGFSDGLTLVYKPRSQSVDAHFGEFLVWMNRAGFETPFHVPTVIDRGDYGWSEYVAHRPCADRAGVERFYRRLGGYLAVFYVLRARDMHFENLIASGEFPVPVDLETLFHSPPTVERDDPAIVAFQTSVMPVMLLPHSSDADESVDMSGFGARSGQLFPYGRTMAWEGAGTDEMRMASQAEAPRIVARSCPALDGQEVDPREFVEPFVQGFRQAYELIASRRDEFSTAGGWLERFGDDEVRFVARSTAAYGELLRICRHPDQLRNAIDRDQVLDWLWLDVPQQEYLARLIAPEAEDLRRGDVPVFTSRPKSRDLWTSAGDRIPEVLEQSPLALVREGLNRLGPDDLARQEAFIRIAIASQGGDTLQQASVRPRALGLTTPNPEAIDCARAIGDMLCLDSLENEHCASWLGTTPIGPGGRSTSPQPLDLTLYNGLPGCALFLAYLASVTADCSYERMARKVVVLLRRHLDRGRRTVGLPITTLGGFSGVGALVYTLTHLAVLWKDATLVDEARALAADVPRLVEADRALDVIGGSAGAIAALDVLNRIDPNDDLLQAAVLCGDRLVHMQQRQPHGGGWVTEVPASQALTGFSHGAAGIAWALLKLATWSGDARFRRAAELAIDYERSTFVAEDRNWPDYRVWPGRESARRCELAWCHGAPGIGLARIDSLTSIDDRDTREEIRIALQTTAGSDFGLSHCLCHGDLGNLEILLYAAQRVDASWWDDYGKALATETLAGITTRGCLCSSETSLAPPGLMVGLAGIGYGLLRIASPERVPSVLVLAPPVTA
jgi:type 2 lantibiotic biosynthesis protein LanM